MTFKCPVYLFIPSLEICRNTIFNVKLLWYYFRHLLTGKKSERDSIVLTREWNWPKCYRLPCSFRKFLYHDRSKHRIRDQVITKILNTRKFSLTTIGLSERCWNAEVFPSGSTSFQTRLSSGANSDRMPPSQPSWYWRVWGLKDAFCLYTWLSWCGNCLSWGLKSTRVPLSPTFSYFLLSPQRRQIQKVLSILPPPPIFHWILLARLFESDEWLLWVCEVPHFSHDKNATFQDSKLLKCHWLCYQNCSQLRGYGLRSVFKNWDRLLVY